MPCFADLEKRIADPMDIMFRGIPCHYQVLQHPHQIWYKLNKQSDVHSQCMIGLKSRGLLV